jgi:hypothetical protein
MLDSDGAMDVGVEISLYPLQQEYLAPIRAFIERLHQAAGVRVVTTSLSTQLFGDYAVVMSLLTRELPTALSGQGESGAAPRVVLLKLVGPLAEAPAG